MMLTYQTVLPGVLMLVLASVTQAAGILQLRDKDSAKTFDLNTSAIQKRADGVLALMSYSVIIDLASSNLSIQGSGNDKETLAMSQLGGGATISKETPLYLEGAVAYSRYDPTFVATDGTDERKIPLKWTTVSGSGGIGWDFPISENWVVRPIFTFSLGKVASDLKLANWWIERQTDRELNFADGGSMNALGLGGALMVDYEYVSPEFEYDLELRYSAVHLQGFANGNSIDGEADSQTANLWTRYRAPTGLTVFSRPLRYVLEFSHSRYYGDQAGALGFDYLSTLGAGIEFDSTAYTSFITRTRLLGRYMFGQNVDGFGISLACSF
ncbi:autotransporter domain-containing protein [Chitinibacter sp. S2-10]|uniref:autotransporter domain-containing protein n=1 Tax=Chitinibacter sp. S2-10 TaxID=3373597 RepID=UPI00397756AE